MPKCQEGAYEDGCAHGEMPEWSLPYATLQFELSLVPRGPGIKGLFPGWCYWDMVELGGGQLIPGVTCFTWLHPLHNVVFPGFWSKKAANHGLEHLKL